MIGTCTDLCTSIYIVLSSGLVLFFFASPWLVSAKPYPYRAKNAVWGFAYLWEPMTYI